MPLSIRTLTLAGLAAALLAADALAQPPAPSASPPTPAATNMRQMGGALRTVLTELNKDAPDAAAVKTAAAKLDTLAGQLPGWFATPNPAAPGRTKPEIWSDRAGFAAASKALQAQTAKLAQLADGTDTAATKAQAATIIGGPCKSCHDIYRGPEMK